MIIGAYYASLLHRKRVLIGFGPSNFFFSNLEKWLSGQWFMSNEEVIAQTDAYFEDLPKSYFLDDLKKLENPLEK